MSRVQTCSMFHAFFGLRWMVVRASQALCRPKKSLHFAVVSPPIGLHFIVGPEYTLQLISSQAMAEDEIGLIFRE